MQLSPPELNDRSLLSYTFVRGRCSHINSFVPSIQPRLEQKLEEDEKGV